MAEEAPTAEQALGPILLIDDEPFVLQMLERAFKLQGFEVATASGGLDGLRKARQLHPAVLVTDLTMPQVDGYAVCTYLRSDPAFADMYVIMLTARARAVDRDRAMQVGANEYITKPVSPREITAHVRQILEQRAVPTG